VHRTRTSKAIQDLHHSGPSEATEAVVHNCKGGSTIALLDTIGMLLERIAASRLPAVAVANNTFPATQMGRSTATALELLTQQGHTVWRSDPDLVASLLSFDISGAFDRVSHERLLHNMKLRAGPRVDGTIYRVLPTGADDLPRPRRHTSRRMATNSGSPHGSALSPILFLFFVCTLLPEL
jgi:hypothetical protein